MPPSLNIGYLKRRRSKRVGGLGAGGRGRGRTEGG